MSDENITIDRLTYTAAVGKKVSGLDYGTGTSDEITVYVQVDVPVGTDPTSADAQLAIRNAVNAGKARVGAALGIDVTINDDGEAVYGDLPEMPAVTVKGAAAPAATAAAAAGPATVDGTPPYLDPESRSSEDKANQKWAVERFRSHPDEFFDNSATRKSDKHPSIKHKKFNKHGGWQNDLVGWAH